MPLAPSTSRQRLQDRHGGRQSTWPKIGSAYSTRAIPPDGGRRMGATARPITTRRWQSFAWNCSPRRRRRGLHRGETGTMLVGLQQRLQESDDREAEGSLTCDYLLEFGTQDSGGLGYLLRARCDPACTCSEFRLWDRLDYTYIWVGLAHTVRWLARRVLALGWYVL